MNEYEKEMMEAPSLKSEFCVICGKPATEQHHVIPRSHGGTNCPTVSLCGFGNTSGCHGMVHQHRLHLRYRNGWQWVFTNEPMKYEKALELDFWVQCRNWEEWRMP